MFHSFSRSNVLCNWYRDAVTLVTRMLGDLNLNVVLEDDAFSVSGEVDIELLEDLRNQLNIITTEMEKIDQDFLSRFAETNVSDKTQEDTRLPCLLIVSQNKLRTFVHSAKFHHSTGFFDENHILFRFAELRLEDQNGFYGLLLLCNVSKNRVSVAVEKPVVSPENIDRFVNFLCGGASKEKATLIQFDRLNRIGITPIGIFGTRDEILDQLQRLGVSRKLCVIFVSLLHFFRGMYQV